MPSSSWQEAHHRALCPFRDRGHVVPKCRRRIRAASRPYLFAVGRMSKALRILGDRPCFQRCNWRAYFLQESETAEAPAYDALSASLRYDRHRCIAAGTCNRRPAVATRAIRGAVRLGARLGELVGRVDDAEHQCPPFGKRERCAAMSSPSRAGAHGGVLG